MVLITEVEAKFKKYACSNGGGGGEGTKRSVRKGTRERRAFKESTYTHVLKLLLKNFILM